jgi:hypothetical protein
MKIKVYVFILTSILLAGAVPAFNFTRSLVDGSYIKLNWKNLESVYSVDWAMPVLAKAAYDHGISIGKYKTFIGRQKWLFLGGAPEIGEIISDKRQGASPDRVASLRMFISGVCAWNSWFKANGVKEFRFMIGPEKDSIYPEYVPDWVRPAKLQLPDLLIQELTSDIYVDTFTPLRAAKARYAAGEEPVAVYYKTDSHWNAIGAWTAMKALTRSLAVSEQDLVWLRPDLERVVSVKDKEGGDIARLLHISDRVQDQEVVLKFDKDVALQTEYFDFGSSERLPLNHRNVAYVPDSLVLMKTPSALNQKKVLWLHDSFGNALNPFMRATFSDILHIHPGFMGPDKLAETVKSYKPDYVIVTAVERSFIYFLNTQYYASPPQ